MATMDIVRVLSLAALPFTLYFAWTKIGCKVDVKVTYGGNRHSAYGIKEITLINRKDKSIAIFEAFAASSDMVLTLRTFSPPLVLKAYEAVNIEVQEASAYYVGDQEVDLLSQIDDLQLNVFLATPSKLVKCRPHDVSSAIGYARKHGRKLVCVSRHTFNGRVYSKKVKYAICCTVDGEHKTFFIDSGGFIDWGFRPNGLHADQLVNAQAVKNALDSIGADQIIGPYIVEAMP
ncbi:hypothetical protein [Castellaniella denitrificans]|uniref:Uncharacterized protein n=1 Tax=Castellaniella denitrificans TaxID=56119 RepID=A0ABT4M239_9BURK|nr:hypothetical protein [Castellaniella denitrificans]MCZ4328515.1 hypothetical protein [Castellaniella denitrificans]